MLLLTLSGIFALLPLATATKMCTVPPNTTMVHDAMSEQVQNAGASQIRAGLTQPWPLITRGNQKRRLIKYCYATKIYRDYLHCDKIMPGFTLWSIKLGYPASAQTGHSLGWEEAVVLKDGKDGAKKRVRQYCYKNYKHGDDAPEWNPLVDPDTLVIALDPTASSDRATVGYNVLNNEPGRHKMILGVDTTPVDIAHELGHVFGMVHEQHRNDRKSINQQALGDTNTVLGDEHVLYECRNVQGYDIALVTAMIGGLTEEEAHTKLCEDLAFAEKHDFRGAEFVKNPQGKIHDDSGGFDPDSIMLYPSSGFANPACDTDKTKCPLLKLVKINGEVVGTNRILENVVPSDGDVAWLKTWYPAE